MLSSVSKPLVSSSSGKRSRKRVVLDVPLFVAAETDGLTKQSVGVFLAGQVEQAPGPPGQDDAVDVDIILNQVLKVVVGVGERFFGQAAKARSAPSTSRRRVASRRASPPHWPAESCAGSTGCRAS